MKRPIAASVALAVSALLLLSSCVGVGDGGSDYYKEFHKKLEDGRTVTCLSAGNSNGFDCDWAGAK